METPSEVLRRLADALDDHGDMTVLVTLMDLDDELVPLAITARFGDPEWKDISEMFARARVKVGSTTISTGAIDVDKIGATTTVTKQVTEFQPYTVDEILKTVQA